MNQFYISPAGDDRWSGRLAESNGTGTDGPFRTLTRARQAVREFLLLGKGAGIQIRDGTYHLDETLVLDEQDSGLPGNPVIWGAYPGEAPVISGGMAMSDWQPWQGKILRALHRIGMRRSSDNR